MGDNLQQPDILAPMKVFQGGGSLDSSQAPESLLPLPPQKMDMIEYKGGGSLEKQKGGDLKNIEPFRKITVDKIPNYLQKHTLLLEIGKSIGPIYEENKLQPQVLKVLPVVPVKGVFHFLKGQTLENIPIEQIYFFASSGGELGPETLQTLLQKDTNPILFFTTLLQSKHSVFVPVTEVEEEQENNSKSIISITNTNINTNTKSVINLDDIEVSSTRTLSSGHIVRFVDDSVKGDIQALRFTPDEKEIFNRIFKVGRSFVKEFIQKPENKESWFSFWRLFINLDGTNTLSLMTNKEAREISIFLQNVFDAYRKYLFNNAVGYLLSADVQPQIIEEESVVEENEDLIKKTVSEEVKKAEEPKKVEEQKVEEQKVEEQKVEEPKKVEEQKVEEPKKVEEATKVEHATNGEDVRNEIDKYINAMKDETVIDLERIVKKEQAPNDFVKEMLTEMLDIVKNKIEIIKEISDNFPKVNPLKFIKTTFSSETIQKQSREFFEALEKNESYHGKQDWTSIQIIEEYLRIFLYLDIKRFPKEDPIRNIWFRIFSNILVDIQDGKSKNISALEGYSKSFKEIFTGGTRKKTTNVVQRRSRKLKKVRSEQTN
jgi:hypothetical protein